MRHAIYPGQTCARHLHFLILTDCPGCEQERERVRAAVTNLNSASHADITEADAR